MTKVICIGSVLWDVIGRTERPMPPGSDNPGRIEQVPGGVAFNIARSLARQGVTPVLLSAVGRDAQGAALLADCAKQGMETGYVYEDPDNPTDRYMAIEGPDGLVAAIADAITLERAGSRILTPLQDGRLASPTARYRGMVALDGNLTEALLTEIATGPVLAKADLRVAPASPGKADRLVPFLSAPNATIYVNLLEAGLLAEQSFLGAEEAAQCLIRMGARRVLVTNGAKQAAFSDSQMCVTLTPPTVAAQRVTGAGDTFMASHMVAELNGATPKDALSAALQAAASFVAGETTYG